MPEYDRNNDTRPGRKATSITNNNSTNAECRGIYIGAADNYDFYVGGSWILFNGCVAGSVIPVQATGARHATGDTAPDAGDIVFLD